MLSPRAHGNRGQSPAFSDDSPFCLYAQQLFRQMTDVPKLGGQRRSTFAERYKEKEMSVAPADRVLAYLRVDVLRQGSDVLRKLGFMFRSLDSGGCGEVLDSDFHTAMARAALPFLRSVSLFVSSSASSLSLSLSLLSLSLPPFLCLLSAACCCLNKN
jgi:hypothetical protein